MSKNSNPAATVNPTLLELIRLSNPTRTSATNNFLPPYPRPPAGLSNRESLLFILEDAIRIVDEGLEEMEELCDEDQDKQKPQESGRDARTGKRQ
mmetsp:Transcript_14256/g.31139  ORF Transcript_14256/g.31139 Transcript_14256/m.31139 type:complete len:95 (+) Transcript_14256:72-356(+)|eukprot:CAMPEP_0168748860 /NCGR_PEP_ID=MMETSP0724-20121128/16400_1 /TAXON_ID=265536 /ORGANISM="Amphiprora sp., Strain CCMP467" /LENGTH=94 /DNA_ID=CAMNT_0008796715 /DNA_START=30 /DNA_END=314 /DNA_ORIENTATION=+